MLRDWGMRAHRGALEDRGLIRHHVLPPTAVAEVPFAAAAGAALGAIAGPPGIIVGLVFGGAAGAALSVALERHATRDAISSDE
jgi:hypothetical protein